MGQKSVKQSFYRKGFDEGQKQPIYTLSNIPYGVLAVSHDKDKLINDLLASTSTFGYKVYLEKITVNTLSHDIRESIQEFTWDFDKRCYE